jgi:hypothetical protein
MKIADELKCVVKAQSDQTTKVSPFTDACKSAHGLIVSLPDNLFDVGQVTSIPGATSALDKLAGVLLIVDDLNLWIEGQPSVAGSARSPVELLYSTRRRT